MSVALWIAGVWLTAATIVGLLAARARLWVVGWIDRIGAGPAEHGHMRAAEWWWRVFRFL